MLELKKDIFSHLVVSANRFRNIKTKVYLPRIEPKIEINSSPKIETISKVETIPKIENKIEPRIEPRLKIEPYFEIESDVEPEIEQEIQIKPFIEMPKSPVQEERTIDSNLEKEFSKNSTRIIKKAAARKINEKIDEKVSKIFENPELKSLKQELEVAEDIFHRLKKEESNKELLWKIENKIVEMRKLIEEKSLV